jgi:uncharacterized membrane protein (DUF4010 family)
MSDYLDSLETQKLFIRLLVTVGIGLLIGLEREFAKRVVEKEEQLFAGIRTYTLISLLGFVSAMLADHYGIWIFAAAFAGFMLLLITAYRITAKPGSFGGTTELASILAFLLAALVYNDHVLFAIIVTVIVTTLLSLKLPLHRFIATLTMQDVRAFIQFVIISAVVLPFLPDKSFGPYEVWNLKHIWSMVVLVSGISLLGYVLTKVIGQRTGILLSGALGGLVSSTAVSLNLSRRASRPGTSKPAAVVGILAACTIMFPRVLLECWIIDPPLAGRLLLPLSLITAAGALSAYFILRKPDGVEQEEVPVTNPLNFGVALQFAALYMGVQWLVAYSLDRFGAGGTYVASLLSGATDMDAITLSLAQLHLNEPSDLAVNGILLAALSNTLFKFGIVIVVGGKPLMKLASIGFGAFVLAGILGYLLVRAFP